MSGRVAENTNRGHAPTLATTGRALAQLIADPSGGALPASKTAPQPIASSTP
jgi:hypothetical protein